MKLRLATVLLPLGLALAGVGCATTGENAGAQCETCHDANGVKKKSCCCKKKCDCDCNGKDCCTKKATT